MFYINHKTSQFFFLTRKDKVNQIKKQDNNNVIY